MPNARELNVGNMIYIPKTKQIAEITGINKHIGVTVNNGFAVLNFNEIEPIKLTEDWLLKFKWQLRKHGNFYINIPFCLDAQGRLYYLNDYTGINIKFVHELQNLYFAINKTDLILEPLEK